MYTGRFGHVNLGRGSGLDGTTGDSSDRGRRSHGVPRIRRHRGRERGVGVDVPNGVGTAARLIGADTADSGEGDGGRCVKLRAM